MTLEVDAHDQGDLCLVVASRPREDLDREVAQLSRDQAVLYREVLELLFLVVLYREVLELPSHLVILYQEVLELPVHLVELVL